MHWILFPARAPKAPSPAHAAPVIAPETAPLKAPSANPSKNDPPFIAAAIPPTAPLSILRPMLPRMLLPV